MAITPVTTALMNDSPEQPDIEQNPADKALLWLLRISCCLCFAGWAWQHVYWDVPLGVVLWDPEVYDFMVGLGIMDWDSFVGDGETESFVRRVVVAVGWFHAVLAVISLTVRKKSYVQLSLLGAGACLLTAVAYCKYVKALRQPAMLIEHGGQYLMPVILILALTCGLRSRAAIWTAVVAFCMTFAGHGAYAIGWAPTPGYFYGMVMVITKVGQELAHTILRTAGILDFIVCVAVFFPFTRRPAVMYAAVWGVLTALARPVAGMSTSLIWWGADQFLHQAIYRTPHFLIPVFLFLVWRTPAAAPSAVETEMTDSDRSDDGSLPVSTNNHEQIAAT
jgi:hypothetical protein